MFDYSSYEKYKSNFQYPSSIHADLEILVRYKNTGCINVVEKYVTLVITRAIKVTHAIVVTHAIDH